MGHPFGNLLLQFRARKPGLSQTRLAQLAGYDQAVLARMCAGKKDLTGPSGRDRVVRVIEVLHEEGALSTLDEANALLAAADLPPLYDGLPVEAALIQSLKGGVAQKPAHRTQPRHNLPAQLTSFVGREKEIAKIAELLARARLVTLTGAGGVGKTRLAIEAAAHVMDSFPDGAWFVDLAPVTDPALVPQVAASAFGLPTQTGSAPLDALLTYLETRQLVLILDNCEHLITGCIALAERVLQACPQVRLLTTSREPLRIGGEAVLRVPPLSIEDEAPRLFVDRAGFDSTNVTITASNADAVKRICDRLEGIPLAIEIAAAQLPAMTLGELSARLDDHFPDMPGMRSAPSRQHTMQATMAWSFGLLAPQEQRLLAWLSVFSGGWTADATDAVCRASDSPSVLPQLIQLVHKSLVIAEPRDGRTRYRLLEPTRQFAAVKLRERGEAEAAHQRHYDYVLALAQAFKGKMSSPRFEAWLDQLDAELANIRAALEWARAQKDGAERVATLVGQLWRFLLPRGHQAEAVEWLKEAYQASKSSPDIVKAHVLMGYTALGMSNFGHLFEGDDLAAMGRESVMLFQTAGDAHNTMMALLRLGAILDARIGDRLQAQTCFQQALDIAREQGDPNDVLEALVYFSQCYSRGGDSALAASTLDEMANLSLSTGDLRGWAFSHLGQYFDDPATERTLGERVIARLRDAGDVEALAASLQVYGRILMLIKNDVAQARTCFEECLALWRQLDRKWSQSGGTARAQMDLGVALGLLDEHDRAIETLLASASDYRDVGDTHGVACAVHFAGRVALLQGDIEQANRHLRDGLNYFRQIGDASGMATVLVALADIARRRGQSERAIRLLAAAANQESNNYLIHDSPSFWREAHQRAIAEAREHSDDPAFIEGQAMTIEQAVAYALSQG